MLGPIPAPQDTLVSAGSKRPWSEILAELERYDRASPAERRCLQDFTVTDIDFALEKFETNAEECDWVAIYAYCERIYRVIDQNMIEQGAKAREDSIQKSLRPKRPVEPGRPSARERLRQLGMARRMP